MTLSNILRPHSRAILFTLICTTSLVYTLSSSTRLVTTSAAGSTITVNSTADVANTNDGLCTLREAITAANTDISSGGAAGECAAGSSDGPDTIDLTGLSGSITLVTALPNITSDATLTGPGKSTLTIQRSTSTFGIFTVSSSATVTISGFAIQGGDPNNGVGVTNSGNATLTLANCTVSGFGAGVTNNSSRALTVSNCVVSGNLNGSGISNSQGTLNVINTEVSGNDSHGGFGPGIDNLFGILNVTNSTISANVGHNAVFNGGTATFTNTTISNNGERGVLSNGNITMTGGSITGNQNGGIIVGGTSVLNGVTVSGNSNTGGTGPGGGGIFINGNAVLVINCVVTNNSTTGNGGGIRNGGGKATIVNTTISGNNAVGGGGGLDTIDAGLASFLAVNLTVTGNRAGFGGGLFIESGVARFKNSIIAGNFDSSGTVPFDITGAVDASSSYNLVGVGGTGLTNGVNNNQVGVADPRLGPLANNGGLTQTHALLSDSPALDAGDNCVTEATHCGEPTLPQLTTDQRGSGFTRIVDGPDANATATVDIGAYEMQLPLANLPDTATNEDTQLIVSFNAGDTSTITSITATSSNTTLVPNDLDHLQAVLAGSTGVVTINPSANLFGTTDITITVNRTGGPEVKIFTLTVNSSNDAPSFTKGSDQTVLEDAGAQTVNNWATNLSTGPADEAGQILTFEVTGNTNPTMFSAGPAISSTGNLTYTPAPNANGTATITIVLKDNGGTSNAGVDTSVPQTLVVTVTPVNDIPTFTKGPDQTVNEDAGTQFLGWATNVSTGAANESQLLTFEVTNNTNPNLFSIQPGVSSTGQLSFRSAPNANGSADITIRLKDNGGTANGGIDTTATQTFTITVLPVNDRPTFTRGPNQTVLEDAGAQTVNNWSFNISPGPPDEAAQTLTVTVTNNNNSLFSAQPALSLSGTLTYTPADNANGSATVTVTFKDNGGTANGGQDTFSQNSIITVLAVNDPPVNTVPGPQNVIKNSMLILSAAESNQISIADVDGGNAARQVTLSATNGLLTLNGTTGLTFLSGVGTATARMTFTGTISNINAALNGLQFAPTNNFVGVAQIQIETNDLGNAGSGGALTDTDTVNVNVVDGNALQFSALSYAVVEGSQFATISVTRTGGGGAASVNYSTSDGSASGGGACGSGTDYVSSSGTLVWAAGETNAKTFTVPICDDSVVEPDETVNLTLSGISGDASLGGPRTAVLTIADAGPPVLLTEENTDHAIALDLVNHLRDPFSLSSTFNLSNDQHRHISLFVWRLALRPNETASDLIVFAEDSEGRNYPLTVEFVGAMSNPPLVTQVVVRLPDNVIGAPRDLKVTVQLRGQATNKGVIKIAAP